MKYVHPYETAESLFGVRMEAGDLIELVRRYSWSKTFLSLAILAAIVANSDDGPLGESVKALTIDPLRDLAATLPDPATRLAAASAISSRRDSMVLAHEQAILYLQHLVLLEGGDNDVTPTKGEIALLLAGTNDHLDDQEPLDDRSAVQSEQAGLGGAVSRLLRFNHSPDMARSLVRAFWIFGERPFEGPLSDDARWRSFQQEAFGGSYDEFFETALAPLYLLTSLWGRRNSSYPNPVVDLKNFLDKSKVPTSDFANFFGLLTTTRADVQRVAARRSDGLPRTPVELIYRPFVETDASTFVATSPWTVLAQLQNGPWALYLSAAKKVFGKRGVEDVWLPAFGYMVEGWCRRIAAEAARASRRAHILTSTYPGAPDEIEDVVVVEDDAAILFSVKATMMREAAARGTGPVTDTVGWFEEFLFRPRQGRYAPGAARLLDEKVVHTRRGDYEHLGLPHHVRLFPVVITYDSLGENDALYKWIERRCREASLLCQDGVAPVTLGDVEDLERLLSMAARGDSIVSILETRSNQNEHRRLDQLLRELDVRGRSERLAFFQSEYERITAQVRRRYGGGAVDA